MPSEGSGGTSISAGERRAALRVGRLVRALACAGLWSGTLGPAAAAPALWAIDAPPAKIYLFGTVHALKPGMTWRSPAVAAAFEQSAELWLEITDPDDPANAGLVVQLGMDPGHPLSAKLGEADRAALQTAASALQLPMGEAALEAMQPWAASLMLTAVPILQAGFDPESGVDLVLKRDASSAGKPVHGFETAAQQFHFLADLPTADQVQMLHETLVEAKQGPAELARLIDDWNNGNLDGLAREDAELRTEAPAIYQRLIVDRDAAWAALLAARAKQPGTMFVAVGTAHLAGPDSLQAALAKLGIEAARLQ